MKKLFFGIHILTAFSCFSQEGDWYGDYKRNNGTTSRFVVHVLKQGKSYTATLDHITENKLNLKAEEVFVEGEDIYLVFSSVQLAIEGVLNSERTEIKGELVNNGKPTPVVLTNKKPEVVQELFTNPVSKTERDGDSSLSPDTNAIRPIAGRQSVFIEDLTWLEVRDAKRAGKNTVIVATGGVEQSGPYIPTGKHNIILRPVAEAIAKKLGNALVAPIIPFVPEDNLDPPSGHLRYPGSIGLREETYEALLTDIVTSYKVEGFQTILLIGDSGGNQWGMYRVSKILNKKWEREGVRVIYVYEYYDNSRISKWLKEQGIEEKSEGIHDSFKVTAQIAAVDPEYIRAQERIAAGKFSINGIELAPVEKTIEWGKKIIEYQASLVVEVIKEKLK